jgi:hypothetical protein
MPPEKTSDHPFADRHEIYRRIVIMRRLQPVTDGATYGVFNRAAGPRTAHLKVRETEENVCPVYNTARLSGFFDWQNALTIVKQDTLIRWHRKGFRLFWKWKSRPRGRPRIPADLQKLIGEMAADNPTWGEERIADELLLKIGIRISHRTLGRDMPKKPGRPPEPIG